MSTVIDIRSAAQLQPPDIENRKVPAPTEREQALLRKNRMKDQRIKELEALVEAYESQRQLLMAMVSSPPSSFACSEDLMRSALDSSAARR